MSNINNSNSNSNSKNSNTDSDSETENDILHAGKYYVYGVNCLIVLLSFTSQYFVINLYLTDIMANKLISLLIFNLLIGYTIINYNLACLTPPGTVSLGWEPPRSGVKVYELKRFSDKPRYCRICRSYKPPRAHHCSDCNKCILKMDHHCPWINNCIGFKNQGHFWRFLFSVVVTCLYSLYFHYGRLHDLISDAYRGTFYHRQPSQTEVSFLVINSTSLFIALMFVGALFCYQTYLVSQNTTSIESSEIRRVNKMARRNKFKSASKTWSLVYPYNLGALRNFQAVLGTNLLTFWVPKQICGDGIEFEIKDALVPPVYWPPKEYYLQYSNAKAEKDNSDVQTGFNKKTKKDKEKVRSLKSDSYSGKSEGPSSSEDSRSDSNDDEPGYMSNTQFDIKTHVVTQPDCSTAFSNKGLVSRIRHRSHILESKRKGLSNNNNYNYNNNSYNSVTQSHGVSSPSYLAYYRENGHSTLPKDHNAFNDTDYLSDEDTPLFDLYSKVQDKKAFGKIL